VSNIKENGPKNLNLESEFGLTCNSVLEQTDDAAAKVAGSEQLAADCSAGTETETKAKTRTPKSPKSPRL
jgi:hypothetical protein